MSDNVLMEGFAMGKLKQSAQRTPAFDRAAVRAPIDDWNYDLGPESRKTTLVAPERPWISNGRGRIIRQRRCSAGMRPVRLGFFA